MAVHSAESSVENHRFIPVQQDAIFDVPANGAREDHFFQVAAFLNQILERIAMEILTTSCSMIGPSSRTSVT